MLTPAKQIKQKLDTGELVIGLMATDHAWTLLVELCQKSGLDYLVIDCEHGNFSDELVSHICQVARLADFPLFIRTISCEVTVVRRMIDLGPCGILLPNVETVAELDQVQDALFMPPRGRRRPGGMGNYWMSDFQHATWKTDFEKHLIVIPQIESSKGIKNVNAIASHPMVTALGLGPYDLSADLGCCWNPENDQYQQAIDTVKAAADSVNKKVWVGCDGPSLRAKGYTFLWVGTVSLVLSNALSDRLKEINENDSTEIPKTTPPPPA